VTPLLEWGLIALAGFGAGTVNAIVGSGTLITFPTLVLLGYPPLLANVSNNVGLVPGSFAGVVGYRAELAGQAGRLRWLAPASIAGGAVGAVALLLLPAAAFDAIVPALVILSVVLVVLQPRLRDLIAHRVPEQDGRPHAGLLLGVFLAGCYGGYFGAAQGVLLMALLGVLLHDDLQRLNGTKNVLAALVNSIAAIVFTISADIDWLVVALIAGGSTLGGFVGARYGRLLAPGLLRALIVVVGTIAVIRLLTA
jgi:uncharacterized membrane protein YfcA